MELAVFGKMKGKWVERLTCVARVYNNFYMFVRIRVYETE